MTICPKCGRTFHFGTGDLFCDCGHREPHHHTRESFSFPGFACTCCQTVVWGNGQFVPFQRYNIINIDIQGIGMAPPPKFTKDRLNIGSGKSTVLYPENRAKYWNVDVRKYEGTDQIADMRIVQFPAESFIEILASDVIDHVTYTEAKPILRKFYQWLKPNGTLRIHTPNLRFLAQTLAQKDNHEAIKWLYGTDGEGSTNYESNCIRWCYSKQSLTQLLEAQGFKILSSSIDCLGFGLNIVAVKP
jgi:hypothetical protein